MELQTGMLVESRAGHDKGSLYVIMDKDDKFVYVCDGKVRTVDHPKRKKEKHVAKVGNVPELFEKRTVSNEDIKRVIKIWRSENV